MVALDARHHRVAEPVHHHAVVGLVPQEDAEGAAIEPDALPAEIAAKAVQDDSCSDGVSLRKAKNEFELRYLRTLLSRTHGNISKAARISKVGRPYLYKKIRQHELTPADFR